MYQGVLEVMLVLEVCVLEVIPILSLNFIPSSALVLEVCVLEVGRSLKFILGCCLLRYDLSSKLKLSLKFIARATCYICCP